MTRTALAAALVAAFTGTAQAAVTELVLYKDSQFRGPSQVIKGEVANLEGGLGHEVSSIVARGGAWEVCTRDHFQGRCRVLPAGEYRELGGLNDRIVSVRFLGNDARFTRDSGWREARREEIREARREDWREARRDGPGGIVLYGQPGFAGRAVSLDDNVPDLAQHRFDNRASSVVVERGVWQLCTEPGYGGRCETFRRGEFRELDRLDERVSSVRRIR